MKDISIQIKKLDIGYQLKHRQQKIVMQNINQVLYNGEVTCLLGRNGAGKSTLLRTLSGFNKPLAGEILLNNKEISRYSASELALNIGLILTDKTYSGGISVFELVSLGRHPHTGFFGKLKPQDIKIINQSMEKAGIAHKSNSYIAELSDGERQKAMIAKVLAQECPIIFLDEPTAFLDINSRIETMVLLHELAEKERKSILISTHDIESAIRLGDRFWLIDKKLPFTSGIPEDLILSGTFEKFFNQNGIYLDRNSGSLQIVRQNKNTIFVIGKEPDSYWMKNALLKNGFTPVTQESFPLIICNSENSFTFKPDQTQMIPFQNIESILNHLIKLKESNSLLQASS